MGKKRQTKKEKCKVKVNSIKVQEFDKLGAKDYIIIASSNTKGVMITDDGNID